MRPGLRSRPWAGIDVGSFSVKVVAAQAGVGGARYWAAEMPFVGGNPDPERIPDADTVARTLSECFAKTGLSARSFRGASLGIGGPDVIVKQIALPLLDESEVGPAMRFEARKHLPFDPQDMILDFQILGRSVTERKLEILLAAVSQEHAERHMAPLRLLGIEPDILDATPLALINAVVHFGEMQHATYMLLDIGSSSSHLAVYQRGEPFFSRRLDFGGRDLSRAIAESTHVPFEEAEAWKLAFGGDEPGLRVDWDSPEMDAISEALRRDLVDELRRSFAFYRTQGRLPDPLRLWLSGGSARLPGLATRLGEILGSPVLLFDPIRSVEAPSHGIQSAGGPQFAQAYGLAMRSL
jgi:type IV pilus assembly protein PilM